MVGMSMWEIEKMVTDPHHVTLSTKLCQPQQTEKCIFELLMCFLVICNFLVTSRWQKQDLFSVAQRMSLTWLSAKYASRSSMAGKKMMIPGMWDFVLEI
jgi:hypothetical protein